MKNALTQYVLNRSTLKGGFKNITLDGRGYPHQYYKCYLINSQKQQSDNDFVLVVISSPSKLRSIVANSLFSDEWVKFNFADLCNIASFQLTQIISYVVA